jgi:hypothetical protein
MTARPILISVIAWLLILVGTIWFIIAIILISSEIATSNSEMRQELMLPLGGLYLAVLVHNAIALIAGIAILNRKSWARWLFVLGTPTTALVTAAMAGQVNLDVPPTSALQIIEFIVIACILFSPIANAYFSGGQPAHRDPAMDVERRSLPFG